MTRIEEATNKIVEFIDIVKDVPKNESILAIGLDMVEWADETMLNKAIEFFQSKSKHGMVEENINVFIDEFCKEMKGE